MKKIRSIFAPYMVRPTIYMCVSRSSLALVLLLLWNRFVNDGTYGVVRDGCSVVGLFMIVISWFSWLKLDGMSRPDFSFMNFTKKRKRFFGRADLVDFVDEHVVSFDELEDDEQTVCVLLADLIGGGLFLLVGLVGLVLHYLQN